MYHNKNPIFYNVYQASKLHALFVGSRYITVFRSAALRDFYVLPSEWKGGQEHADDILALSFLPPNSLASASYDGEIVLWNNNSEQASRHLTQRFVNP